MNKYWLIASIAAASLLAGCATTKQTSAPTAPPVAAKPAGPNISGMWALTIDTPMGAREMKMNATQTGETLSGKIATEMGELPITGTVKGNDLAFMMKVNAQGMDLQIDYTGTVEGDTMKGNAKLGDFGNGTFTGKKL